MVPPQVPAFLEEVSVRTEPTSCTELGFPDNTFMAFARLTQFEVLDQNKFTIAKENQRIEENNVATGGTCEIPAPPNDSSWLTYANGRTVKYDVIANCSGTCFHGGDCTANWNQSFKVEGRPVDICELGCSASWPTNTWSTSCSHYPLR